MAQNKEEILSDILRILDSIEYIKLEDIPNIDLYMDQVTTFMDRKLRAASRDPMEDKVLTKTMINNYAKNDLLPPPVKKKYSKEHVLLLIFIYYYKGILSISDIQTLLAPITDRFFQSGRDFDLEKVYYEVFESAHMQKQTLMEDVKSKFALANESFADAPDEDAELLRMFSFICQLSVDVYLKKQIIERLIDQFAKESAKQIKSGAKSEKSQKGDKSAKSEKTVKPEE